MNTTDTSSTSHALRRFAAIAIVGGLALSFAAAFAALRAEPAVASGGIFALMDDYITQVSEALGSD